MADQRKPEFISLMRTIRDVYYKEMGAAMDWIKSMSITFEEYNSQIRNPGIGNVVTVAPIDDSTFGVADVTLDVSNPNQMLYSFDIPAGLKGDAGDQGAGVNIVGVDTYANILLKTTAQLGECWISSDVPAIAPPSGVAEIQDGLVPRIANPQVEADWVNVGQLRGPAGSDGTNGQDGSDGLAGSNGAKWWTSPQIPTDINEIPGSATNDHCIVSSSNLDINGNYYLLTATEWLYQGVLNGDKGDEGTPGSVWHNGSGVPSDSLGINGDYYLDFVSGVYYYKENDIYSVIGSVTPVGNPVGSVVLRMDDIDADGMHNLYGGTWALITGDASLSFGDGTTQDGAVVGSDSQTVTLLEHTHTFTGTPLATHQHDNGVSFYDDNQAFEVSPYGTNDIANTASYVGLGTSAVDNSHSGNTGALSAGTPIGTNSNTGTAGATMDVAGARISINVWRRIA